MIDELIEWMIDRRIPAAPASCLVLSRPCVTATPKERTLTDGSRPPTTAQVLPSNKFNAWMIPVEDDTWLMTSAEQCVVSGIQQWKPQTFC